jgi:ring-1,2-phenylacetyl-CoA epoxidase subunit PaaC
VSHPTKSLAGAHDSAGAAVPMAEHLALATYAMRLGDDALVLSHRLGEWVTNAPQLEEDVALGNIALDLLGQARTLLSYAGEVERADRSEDDLAYLRDEREFANVHLVELVNEDFAVSMARQLAFSTYQLALYERLESSTDETLAAVAAKAVKEVDYHRDHATQWVLRLGDGTEESHRRMQAGLARVWPYVDELFVSDDVEQSLVADGVAVDASTLRPGWDEYVDGVLAEATLERPEGLRTPPGGGRRGIHTEAMGYLLAEMQSLHRAHPGATW